MRLTILLDGKHVRNSSTDLMIKEITMIFYVDVYFSTV